MTEQTWWNKAACRNEDTEIFFPEPGEQGKISAAKAICRRCPVQTACLQHALDTDEPHGIMGGLGPRGRIRLKKGANALNISTCAMCETEFQGGNSRARYCSEKCQQSAFRLRKRELRRAERQLVCPGCGVEFVGHGLAKYCSAECRTTAAVAKRRAWRASKGAVT